MINRIDNFVPNATFWRQVGRTDVSRCLSSIVVTLCTPPPSKHKGQHRRWYLLENLTAKGKGTTGCSEAGPPWQWRASNRLARQRVLEVKANRLCFVWQTKCTQWTATSREVAQAQHHQRNAAHTGMTLVGAKLGYSWVLLQSPPNFSSIKSGVLSTTWRKEDTAYSKLVSKKLEPNPEVSGNLLITVIWFETVNFRTGVNGLRCFKGPVILQELYSCRRRSTLREPRAKSRDTGWSCRGSWDPSQESGPC